MQLLYWTARSHTQRNMTAEWWFLEEIIAMETTSIPQHKAKHFQCNYPHGNIPHYRNAKHRYSRSYSRSTTNVPSPEVYIPTYALYSVCQKKNNVQFPTSIKRKLNWEYIRKEWKMEHKFFSTLILSHDGIVEE